MPPQKNPPLNPQRKKHHSKKRKPRGLLNQFQHWDLKHERLGNQGSQEGGSSKPQWSFLVPKPLIYIANWVIVYITYHLLREPETAIENPQKKTRGKTAEDLEDGSSPGIGGVVGIFGMESPRFF